MPFNDQPIHNGGTVHANGHTNGDATLFKEFIKKDANGVPIPNPSLEDFDLSSRLTVNRSEKAFASGAVSLVDVPAGALFARITTATPAVKAYSSVQVSPTQHIELNTDLVYCNHSCAPSLLFDMSRFEVRVNPELEGGIKKGDALTFWYPSTEWDMAQPFDCNCGAEKCRGTIDGAGNMKEDVLREYWLNPHIERMLAEKRGRADSVQN